MLIRNYAASRVHWKKKLENRPVQVCEATTRNGRLKTQRHGKGDLMLREDLASLEYISEDILVDHLR